MVTGTTWEGNWGSYKYTLAFDQTPTREEAKKIAVDFQDVETAMIIETHTITETTEMPIRLK